MALGLALWGGCSGPSAAADTKRSTTRLELAKDWLSRGELEQAAEEAEKALSYDQNNVEAINLLGLVEYLRALRNFRLLEVDDCLTGVDSEALRAEEDAFLSRADRHFARAVELVPEYGEAWANRGAVALLLEDYEVATGHLERALSFPHSLLNIALTRANLGWAFFHRNDHAKAAKELLQAEQFNPGMCVAKYRLGRVYFAREEWNKALEQFQEVAANASCPMQEAHLYLLKTYVALDMKSEAESQRTECVAMASKSCIAAKCQAAQ